MSKVTHRMKTKLHPMSHFLPTALPSAQESKTGGQARNDQATLGQLYLSYLNHTPRFIQWSVYTMSRRINESKYEEINEWVNE